MSVYVAFEGGDGAGKSTVVAAVAERLRAAGRSVLVVREPGGTAIGEEIRSIVLHGRQMAPWTEALLFAAQRAELAASVIKPALAEGVVVLSDRTYYSSLAYQGGARGLGLDQVRSVNEIGLEGVVPDLVEILDLEADAGLAREEGPDRISSTGGGFSRTVSETYRTLAAADPARVRLVDATRPVDEIADEIADEISDEIAGRLA